MSSVLVQSFPKLRQGVEKRWRGSQSKSEAGEKCSLRVVNEHFEPALDAAMATLVVFQLSESGQSSSTRGL
jgi:hypothetical protein